MAVTLTAEQEAEVLYAFTDTTAITTSSNNYEGESPLFYFCIKNT